MPKKSSISFDATSLTYNMVYMNADGEFIDSELPAAVRSRNEFLITHDFIPLPEGSSLDLSSGTVARCLRRRRIFVCLKALMKILPLSALFFLQDTPGSSYLLTKTL